MEIRIRGSFICTDCGHVMRAKNPKRTEYACSNEECRNFSKKFAAPTMKINEVGGKKKTGGKK